MPMVMLSRGCWRNGFKENNDSEAQNQISNTKFEEGIFMATIAFSQHPRWSGETLAQGQSRSGAWAAC